MKYKTNLVIKKILELEKRKEQRRKKEMKEELRMGRKRKS